MRSVVLVFALIISVSSCKWAKDKTREAANKTGEAIGQAGSEFTQGVTKGVEKIYSFQVAISDGLSKQGLKTGKVSLRGTDSSSDNIVNVYFIFENDFDRKVVAKAFGSDGLEFGRTSTQVKGAKGEAGYLDFVFDKRTNIDSKAKVTLE